MFKALKLDLCPDKYIIVNYGLVIILNYSFISFYTYKFRLKITWINIAHLLYNFKQLAKQLSIKLRYSYDIVLMLQTYMYWYILGLLKKCGSDIQDILFL